VKGSRQATTHMCISLGDSYWTVVCGGHIRIAGPAAWLGSRPFW
jgi:hypothetical protein